MSKDRIQEQIEAVAAEDWILIGLALLVIVPVAYGLIDTHVFDGTPASDADPAVVAFCEETASQVEEQATFARDVSCDCRPPGTFDPEPYQVDETLDNRTELFLVECEADGETQIFPIRRAVNGSVGNETDGVERIQ